jgi:hypothetical protein
VIVTRKLVVTAVALGLVALPLAGSANAEAGYWTDPARDCCSTPGDDIIKYSLALNSEVVATSVTFSAYDRAVLQSADVMADIDVNGDGATDYEFDKEAGGESAVLRDDEFGDLVPGCPVAFHIEPYPTTVSMSTTAACLGSPTAVRVKFYVSSDVGFDVAPGFDLFSPAVYRGYRVIGAIADKWGSLGGPTGTIGQAVTDEMGSANGGRYNLFQRGAIYWTAATGAHMVRGAIRDTWGRVGAEWGVLGYPKTDEIQTGGRPGAVNLFQGGSVYWSSTTGGHAMYGAILQAWGSQGYEAGRLGFPRTDEFDAPDGRKQEFQGGNIVWTPQRGAVIAYR